MPSSYSTSLRLELMADGEKSGTWGTITNTNLGTLIEQGVAGVASVAHDDSASYTLTTNNGSSDEARNAVVLMTGALTADREVIVPDVDKVYIFKNGTSGGFALTFKTSGGSGVTIPNGRAAICYVDSGTGTVNAIDDGYFTDSIYIEGSSAGDFITAESTNAGATSGPDIKLYRNSASPADSDVLSKITFTANTDDGAGGVSVSDVEYASINVSAPETNETSGEAGKMVIALKRGGTTQNYIEIQGGTSADADNDSIVFKTGGSAVLTIDNNQDMLVDTDSKLQFRDSAIYIQSGSDGNLNIEADTAIAFDTDTLYVDSANNKVGIGTASPDLLFHIKTADDGGVMTIESTSATSSSGPNFNLLRTSASPADNDNIGKINFQAYDDGSNNTVYANIQTLIRDTTDTTEDGRMLLNTILNGALVSRVELDNDETVINENSYNLDFRVESDAQTHMLFVDASTSRIGIRDDSPTTPLSLRASTSGSAIMTLGDYDNVQGGPHGFKFFHQSATAGDGSSFVFRTGDNSFNIEDPSSNQQIKLYTTTGAATFNEQGNDADFRVESNGNTHMLFVDANNDYVGVGENSPTRKLHINGGSQNTVLKLESTDAEVYAEFRDSGGASSYVGFNGTTMRFLPNNTEAMSIYDGGDIRMLGDNSTEQSLIFRTSSSAGRAVKKSISRGDSGATNPMVEIQMDGYGTNSYLGQMNVLMTPSDTYNSATIDVFNIQATVGATFNEDGVSYNDFRVESDSASHMLFVDAGSNAVGVNTSSPKNDAVMEIVDDGLASGSVLRVSADDSVPYALVVANNTHSTTTTDGLAMWMGTSSRAFMDVRGGSGQSLNFRIGGSDKVSVTENGLTFNGDTAAANALDDYEEGTYQVSIGTSVSGTVTLNATWDDASYVKIGNVVHVQGALDVSSSSSPTGYFTISLPFTAKNDSPVQSYRAVGSVNIYNTASVNISQFVSLLVQGESSMRVYLGDGTNLQQDSAEQLNNGASPRIAFQVTYRTT